jgi:L-asparaginase II
LFVSGKQTQVGFELELSGTHETGADHASPGCPACRSIFSALKAVAEHVLPKDERASRYEIEPYEPALRYSSLRGNRPDVTLKVKILHRQGFDKPVDGCELRCLAEIKADLHKLGACERHWSVAKDMHSYHSNE